LTANCTYASLISEYCEVTFTNGGEHSLQVVFELQFTHEAGHTVH